MKVIPVSPHATEINGLLDQARHEEVLLQSADGSEFLLVAVDDFAQEVLRTRQNGTTWKSILRSRQLPTRCERRLTRRSATRKIIIFPNGPEVDMEYILQPATPENLQIVLTWVTTPELLKLWGGATLIII